MKRSVLRKGQNWYQSDNFSISLPHISLQLESKRKDNENFKSMPVVWKEVIFGKCSQVSRLQLPTTLYHLKDFITKKEKN